MTTVWTKKAVEVYAPTTAAGAQRGASMGEAAQLGTEYERAINAIEEDIATGQTGTSEAINDLQERVGQAEVDINSLESIATSGVAPKASVRVATTANGTLATAFDNASAIDGVTLATGNRILIKNQTAGEVNGIYVVQASGAPVRATDADTADEILRAGVFVEEGTTQAGTSWVCNTPSPITLETTPLTFVKNDDKSGFSAEISAARQSTPALKQSLDAVRSLSLTELAERIFDPMTPVFRSGRNNVEATPPTSAIGLAQPFDWDGTRFDYVKVWVRPFAAADLLLRVGIWSADRSTLYASGYVTVMRQAAASNYVWVKLDRPITTSVVSAGVLYFSVDGISSDTALNGRLASYEVDERNTPDLATYPLYVETYTPTPSQSLSTWNSETDTLRNGIVFELYNSRSTSKRGMQKNNPRAEEIVMTPRLCGIVGTEMNVYLRSLVAGRGEKGFHATGISVGRQLSERWTATPASAIVGGTLTLKTIDLDNPNLALHTKTTTVDVVAQNAAAAATRVICAIGDSNTSGEEWINRVLDKAGANVNGVQPTFQGTKGVGAAMHEGVGGRRLIHVYRPTTAGLLADNPFVELLNGYFDASYYMSNNPTFTTPEIVIWAGLGTNEAIAQHSTSETVMMGVARDYCQQLGEMIGVFASANPVVPWSEVDSGIKHIVALPIASGTQDGFGVSIYAGLNYHEAIAHRYLHILRNRIVQVFGSMEGDGIFLMPWHVTNDPVIGYPFTNEVWNVNTTRTLDRAQDAIHPDTTALSGLQQMGDAAWAMLNVGVAKGWF